MASQYDPARCEFANIVGRGLQPRAIAGAVPGHRWPVRSDLAEWEVVPQDEEACVAERLRDHHEQTRLRVATRAVRQDDAVGGRGSRGMYRKPLTVSRLTGWMAQSIYDPVSSIDL